MSDLFAVEAYPAERLLRMRFSGLWSSDTMHAFEAELMRCLQILQRAGIEDDGFDAVVDLRDHQIQTQDVARQFGGHADAFSPKPRRIANLLSASMLQRLQAQRIADMDRSRFFTDEESALAWLRSP